MAEPVYKVLSEAAFEQAWLQGQFHGSADDAYQGDSSTVEFDFNAA